MSAVIEYCRRCDVPKSECALCFDCVERHPTIFGAKQGYCASCRNKCRSCSGPAKRGHSMCEQCAGSRFEVDAVDFSTRWKVISLPTLSAAIRLACELKRKHPTWSVSITDAYYGENGNGRGGLREAAYDYVQSRLYEAAREVAQ